MNAHNLISIHESSSSLILTAVYVGLISEIQSIILTNKRTTTCLKFS